MNSAAGRVKINSEAVANAKVLRPSVNQTLRYSNRRARTMTARITAVMGDLYPCPAQSMSAAAMRSMLYRVSARWR